MKTIGCIIGGAASPVFTMCRWRCEPSFHDVYASPGTVAAYNKTAELPDDALLVKQISGIKAEHLTPGNAHYAGDTGVWFVMVRDQNNRFPDNPIRGEGWGWALFKADSPSVNVNENWKHGGLSNCYACHVSAKAKGWVYTKGYPTQPCREINKPTKNLTGWRKTSARPRFFD